MVEIIARIHKTAIKPELIITIMLFILQLSARINSQSNSTQNNQIRMQRKLEFKTTSW